MVRYYITLYRNAMTSHYMVDATPWLEQAGPKELEGLSKERIKASDNTIHYEGFYTRSILDWLISHHPTAETENVEQTRLNHQGDYEAEINGSDVDRWFHTYKMKSLAMNAVDTILNRTKR